MGLAAAILDQLDLVGDWGLLATDADLVVTRWNRWLEHRSGLASADVVGRKLFDIFPDLLTRRLDRYYRQVLDGQTVLLSQRLHKFVIPLPLAAGESGPSYLQQTSRIVPIMDGPAVSGTLTLVEDVTERVAYESELRARARQQAAVAAVARSGLAGGDGAAVAREVVGQLRDTLDVDFVEVLEQLPDGSGWAVVAGTGWAQSRSAVVDVQVADQAVDEAGADTADVLTPAGIASDPHLRAHAVKSGLVVRVPGPGDRPHGLLGVYTHSPRHYSAGEALFVQALASVLGSAAERRRLEEQLRLRAEELREADRRKDEFLATLAHELRNPLAPIRNAVGIMQGSAADPATVRLAADMIGRQTDQMVRFVDDLLDVSRITLGKIELRTGPLDLASVVHQAVEAARPLIEARGHALTVTVSPGPISLTGDAARLVQVIGNLLSNAAKFTGPGGRIDLTAGPEDGRAVVRVRDTGIGLAADKLPTIFGLFSQVDSSLERTQGGLGIGLSLVKSLVELHGGSVEARSAGVGKGSEFVVRLPALSGPPTPAPAEPPKGTVAPRRVLVVDDNKDSADSLAMLLRLYGHEVHTAHDGPGAVKAAAAVRPDVILLDIGLPGLNGYEVGQAIRAHGGGRRVLIVALTGWGQDADRQKSRKAGFDHHLVKPVNLATLGSVIPGLIPGGG